MKKGSGSGMKQLMSKWMIACDEASYLISYKQDNRLGLWKWLKLKMHLLSCHLCRRYEKQIRQIGSVLENYRSDLTIGEPRYRLDEDARIRIVGKISDELEKK